MSYRIVYGPDRECYVAKKRGKPWLLFGIFAAGLLVTHMTGMGAYLRQWLMPGDAEITEAALESLAENLLHGANLREVVTVFCEEILSGSGLQ